MSIKPDFESPYRGVVYASDLVTILNCSDRHASRLMKLIRETHNKKRGQYIIPSEAATVLGIPETEIIKRMR